MNVPGGLYPSHGMCVETGHESRIRHISIARGYSYEAIVDACCKAWNALLGEARRITSIATRTWATIGQ